MKKPAQMLAALLASGMLLAAPADVAAAPMADQTSATISTSGTAPASAKKVKKRYFFHRTAATKPAAPAAEDQVTANLNQQSLRTAETGKAAKFTAKSSSSKTAHRVAKAKTSSTKRTKARRNGTTAKTEKA